MFYDVSKLEEFPVFSRIDETCRLLKESKSHCIVVTAETGAGKSTVLPLGILKNFFGNAVMTEPRRLSVLGTCARISSLMGEECGETAGYAIRNESIVSSGTRLKVVTEAILVRMLQDDFALEDFNVVILDEFHERSVHLDLISVFLKEALELRDDLYVVIMSATIDAKKISGYFYDAPIMKIEGRTFPVEIKYKPNVGIETAVKDAFINTMKGSILVFLPGISEIKKCAENLKTFFDESNAEILILHSSISMAEQARILETPSISKRRIIISSAIAETSLTVPEITAVVDCGLCRMNVHDAKTGMQKLITVAESDFSAAQRAGRAGRTEKGKCIRLWSRNDVREKESLPEILRCDLSSVVLECAERGLVDLDKIEFIDRPSESSWKESVSFLEKNGMLEKSRITEKGKAALKLGTEIRIAGILLAAKNDQKLLSFAKKIFEAEGQDIQKDWNVLCGRLKKIDYVHPEKIKDSSMLLLEGYADRLAKKISSSGEKTECQLITGKKAFLHASVKTESPWIVALECDAGNSSSLIYKAMEISGDEFSSWVEKKSSCEKVVFFKDGKIQKQENFFLGKICLFSRKLNPEPSDVYSAWKNEIQKKGIVCLPLEKSTYDFLLRAEFFRQQKGVSAEIEKELCDNADMWLAPFMSSGKNLDAKTVHEALYWYLDGRQIDSEVPSMLEFPNGKKLRVKYEKNERIRPVVEVIIQRVFGCFRTPEVMGQKVLLKLLSPASRPLQVTDDLEHFWTSSWIEICKEMKGRYPKHDWDYKKTDS